MRRGNAEGEPLLDSQAGGGGGGGGGAGGGEAGPASPQAKKAAPPPAPAGGGKETYEQRRHRENELLKMILEDNTAVLQPYARAALPAFGVFGWAFAEFRLELFSPLLIAAVASSLLYAAWEKVVPKP